MESLISAYECMSANVYLLTSESRLADFGGEGGGGGWVSQSCFVASRIELLISCG